MLTDPLVPDRVYTSPQRRLRDLTRVQLKNLIVDPLAAQPTHHLLVNHVGVRARLIDRHIPKPLLLRVPLRDLSGLRLSRGKKMILLSRLPVLHVAAKLVQVFQSYMNLNDWRRNDWTPAVKAAGLSHRPPYAMRHTYALFSIAAEVALFTLARRMGTSVEQIDKTYGHLLPDAAEHERGLLDAFDAQKPSGVVIGTR